MFKGLFHKFVMCEIEYLKSFAYIKHSSLEKEFVCDKIAIWREQYILDGHR